ncbi:MAG TPA: hypothetical protein VKT29_15180, partial [Terriglobales bacterium]|nr:hypothetical protein [Terriglobales bacterium]
CSAGGAAAGLDPTQEWGGQFEAVIGELCEHLEAALRLPELEHYFSEPWPEEARFVLPTAGADLESSLPVWGAVLAWCAIHALGRLSDPQEPEPAAAQLFDSMHLREALADALTRLGLKDEERWRAAARIRAAFAHAGWAPGAELVPGRSTALFSWVHDPDVAWVIGVHEWESIRYFVKEPYERLLWWMALPALIMLAKDPQASRAKLHSLEQQIETRLRAAAEGGYRVEALFEAGA